MISRTISFSLGDEESDVLSFDSLFFSSALWLVDGFVSLLLVTEELLSEFCSDDVCDFSIILTTDVVGVLLSVASPVYHSSNYLL